jgi:hypothetical protein
MLLFLIAGYPSDAAEIAAKISKEKKPGVAATLTRSLADLAMGHLRALLERPLIELPLLDTTAWDTAATEALWLKLLEGLRSLAALLLGLPIDHEFDEPLASFQTVQRLSVERLTWKDEHESKDLGPTYSIFAGPHHLATLLLEAGSDLLKRTVVSIPTPPSVTEESWQRYVTDLATRRPYLWPNHLQAISDGYLDPGLSAAISFPTGAGKSTLAELRIAVALLRGEKTLFLVPTHALVAQVTQDLRISFPEAKIRNSVITDEFYAEVERAELPDVAVMTPERCLALLGIDSEPFTDLGLLVFDECHLLHPKSRDDRRSLDSMLCLLNIFSIAANIKVLMMSAMMSNAKEIADWLTDMTGTRCLPLELKWKPTRQVRGCVAFPATEIKSLRDFLSQERIKIRAQSRNTAPPKRIQSALSVLPFGLFCLSQTWENLDTSNYSLMQLLDHPVNLTANKFWSLMPNRNHVATEIASRFAQLGMKTIVFAQNPNHAVAIARNAAAAFEGSPEVTLDDNERELFAAAVLETDGADHAYSPFNNLAACHHGLMLPVERRLSESIFARRDGANLLAATPTLAQGMNLPAQVVIIAGDDRFDQSTDRSLRLEAHEVLNAAGRAGRAGYNSQGMVLVVPGAVIDFNSTTHTVPSRWFELQERIFSQSDQCLAIEDPIEALLDFIQIHGATTDATATYFIHRLPVSSDETTTERFLGKSLGAFHAKKRGDIDLFLEKSQKVALLQSQILLNNEVFWHTELASKSGVPPALITALDHDLGSLEIKTNKSTHDWLEWFLNWTKEHDIDSNFLNATELREWFKIEDREELLKVFAKSVSLWISGATLREIELSMNTQESKLGYCHNARKLTIRNLPHLAYGLGLVAQTYRYRLETSVSMVPMPISLATASACVRNGFDKPEKLAIQFKSSTLPRIGCHHIYNSILEHLDAGESSETFFQTQARVDRALSTIGL